jgi:cardiolipin synthase
MFAAIAKARDHVNLQTYIIEADEVGERLAELLSRKRAEGVKVNLLYDSVGSIATPKEYFDRLRSAGIAVCEFNPVNPLKAPKGWQINNRDHRKILVVDGRTAFTGGINISGVYSAGSFGSRRAAPSKEEGWRDTHILVRGPVVAEFQRLFVDAWAQQKCEGPAAGRFFPRIPEAGPWTMRVLASDPEADQSETYIALLSAIAQAEQRVWLTYGYFVPDPTTIETLQAAAARGVDVRLVLPGFSDFWAPLYAGRSHYQGLLAAGVRIFERHDALLHAKTAVIDGVWSSVGSTNLDWRSFVHNYEADVIVLAEAFAREMERLFALDIEASHEITLDEWRQRGLDSRLREGLARIWEYFL